MINAGGLQHDTEPAPERLPLSFGVEPQHQDLTRVAPTVSLQDLDGRRLAGPVRTEQGEDVAVLDPQVYAGNGATPW
jgi:hypothetical protein